jgi:outer membrane protein TolC
VHAAASLGAAEAAEAAARATHETFRQRREQGLLTEADVLQAEAELSAAEATRADAERARLDALQDLGQQLGWDPDTLPLPTDTLQAPEPLPEAPFEPERRADIRGLSAAIEAADAARRQASMELAPALEVSAVYVKHAGELFSSDATDWTVNVALRWTLFSGFGRFARIDRAAAERRIARLEYADAVRRARRESDGAERAVAAARRQVEATGHARSAAEAARDLMRRRFEQGLSTATDLLQAEARARDMRVRAIAALAGYHVALARLEFVRSQASPANPR